MRQYPVQKGCVLIRLKNKLTKIHNIWHLPLCSKYLSPKPATIAFVSFAVSGLTSIPQLPVPLLPISFTPNLTTVIISTINSLSLNYPVSSRSRTLLLILSLKILSPAISLPSYALSTVSESMNALNTSSCLLPTKFSQLPNLHTFITSSLSNLLVILALYPSLLLLGHLYHPVKITDRCFRNASQCLWNQLYLFINFWLTYSFTYYFFLFCFTTLLIRNSLSFTPSLKPTSFTDPITRSSTSSSWTAFTDFCLRHFFWANRFLF